MPLGQALCCNLLLYQAVPEVHFFYTIHSADHIGIAQLRRQNQRRGIIETNEIIAHPNM